MNRITGALPELHLNFSPQKYSIVMQLVQTLTETPNPSVPVNTSSSIGSRSLPPSTSSKPILNIAELEKYFTFAINLTIDKGI